MKLVSTNMMNKFTTNRVDPVLNVPEITVTTVITAITAAAVKSKSKKGKRNLRRIIIIARIRNYTGRNYFIFKSVTSLYPSLARKVLVVLEVVC